MKSIMNVKGTCLPTSSGCCLMILRYSFYLLVRCVSASSQFSKGGPFRVISGSPSDLVLKVTYLGGAVSQSSSADSLFVSSQPRLVNTSLMRG